MRFFKLSVFFLLLSVSATRLRAQKYFFKNYQVSDGLSNEVVNALFEDSKGFLWIGTQLGLNRYDKHSFEIFTTENGLSGNDITSIKEDKTGRLWIGTNGTGITYFENSRFYKLQLSEATKNCRVFDILCLPNGEVWFATFGHGILIYKNKTITELTRKNSGQPLDSTFCFAYDAKKNLINVGTRGYGIITVSGNADTRKYAQFTQGLEGGKKIFSMCIDKEGMICAGTIYDGLWFFDGVKFSRNELFSELNEEFIGSVIIDHLQNTWIATSESGMYKATPANSIKKFTEEEGVVSNKINVLFEDYERNIWCGTADGISNLSGETHSIFSKAEQFPLTKIVSSILLKNGKIIIANENGEVFSLTGSTAPKIESVIQGASGFQVTSFHQNSAGSIVAATTDSVYFSLLPKENSFVLKEMVTRAANGKQKPQLGNMLSTAKGEIWGTTFKFGVHRLKNGEWINYTVSNSKLPVNDFQYVFEDSKKNIWLGSYQGGLVKFANEKFTCYNEQNGFPYSSVNCITELSDGILAIGTETGGLIVWSDGKIIRQISAKNNLSSNNITGLVAEGKNSLWVSTDHGINYITGSNNFNSFTIKFFGAKDGVKDVTPNTLINSEKEVWFASNSGWNRIDKSFIAKTDIVPMLIMSDLLLNNEKQNWQEISGEVDAFGIPLHLSLPYNKNHLSFFYKALSTNELRYEYKLEGFDKNWIRAGTLLHASYPNIPSGTYTFKVKAITSNFTESKTLEYTFVINKAWYLTWWFISLAVLTLAIAVFLFIKSREKKLVREKNILEKKVEIRTEELRKQKHLVEEKNKEITDSINYAKGLQENILPPIEEINEHLNTFIYYQPKDIVAGDFYWYHQTEHFVFLAAADCTGHGVPGAMTSVVCSQKFTEVVERYILDPAKILKQVSEEVKKAFKKNAKDGMDCSLIRYNIKTGEVVYAGANRPLVHIDSATGEIIEYKPTKSAIGHSSLTDDPFEQHVVPVKNGDCLYMFTDGYPDQFGGPKGKKLSSKKLKEILQQTAPLDFSLQEDEIRKQYKAWLGDFEQIDDVCVIGIKMKLPGKN